MQRVVHLDLKGAPLKVSYLEKVLICMKNWGATGILFEWEDTFPYNQELEVIGSIRGCSGDEMYSRREVTHLMKFARQNGLEPIQLVQTIGHMEFVLKHEKFKNMRENPRSSAVLCPLHLNAQRLVRDMIQQILDVQPDAKYLHIGADEVWYYGICEKCRHKAQSNIYGAASLYLDHVRDLTLYIKQQSPELTVLFWDDMLRSMDVEVLKTYQLGHILQPVLWHYNALEEFMIDTRLLKKYSEVFPCVWAGSAFKGANGSCRMTSPVSRYHGNHVAWLNTIKNNANVNFSGIILTGWTRFDHYATFCELLPVSLPSLANCLRVIQNHDEFKEISREIKDLNHFEWPGHEVASYIETFSTIKQKIIIMLHDDHVSTWLNPWQIENNYTNPAQVEGIHRAADELLRHAEALKHNIFTQLSQITGPRSVNEWIHTNCTSLINQLKELCEKASSRSRAEAGIEPGSIGVVQESAMSLVMKRNY